jgi:hypothetical protein
MTGLERNADIVHMSTYAPLFAHVEGWQWKPDLIWFDNLRSVRSVNYLVQQLYGENKGTRVLKTLSGKEALTGQNGIFASAVIDDIKKEIVVKIANTSSEKKNIVITLNGLKKGEKTAIKTLLESADLDIENTLDNPDNIQLKKTELKVTENSINITTEPMTFTMFNIKL